VQAGGEYTARTLVNAAGAWADLIAGIAGVTPLGIVPHRRSMARLAAPGGHDTTDWPMFFGTGESWYAKPDAGALLVSPAEEVATHPHDAFADDMTLAEGLDRYQSMVSEAVTRPIATWAGLRSFAPDRTLVLGRDAHHLMLTLSRHCDQTGSRHEQTARQCEYSARGRRSEALRAISVA